MYQSVRGKLTWLGSMMTIRLRLHDCAFPTKLYCFDKTQVRDPLSTDFVILAL